MISTRELVVLLVLVEAASLLTDFGTKEDTVCDQLPKMEFP